MLRQDLHLLLRVRVGLSGKAAEGVRGRAHHVAVIVQQVALACVGHVGAAATGRGVVPVHARDLQGWGRGLGEG